MTSEEKAEFRRLLKDISFWGDRITDHLAGIREEQFAENPLVSDAVCWCLNCIGEAAGAIRRRWPELQAELDLAQAYAMRNRIAHGYFAIDLGMVWRTANESVPAMTRNAAAKLKEL